MQQYASNCRAYVEFESSLITSYMQLQCEFCMESEIVNFVRAHKNLLLEPALKVSVFEINFFRPM